MHLLKVIFGFSVLFVVFSACEERIVVDTDTSESELVVDAWITNERRPQVIKLRLTSSYFDASASPAATGATVTITDTFHNVDSLRIKYIFIEDGNSGDYIWTPDENSQLFTVGRDYVLSIDYEVGTYTSLSGTGRVPLVDSIFYEYREESLGEPAGYYAQLIARDPPGKGDAYWIRTYKNGKFLNKPQEINLCYDGSFSPNGNADGLYFISPIRERINRFPDDGAGAVDDENVAPYALGDSIFVEIYTITDDAFDFLNEIIIQMDRDGGVQELFAQPIANVATNIHRENEDQGLNPVGFFCVSTVATTGTVIREQ